VTPTLPEPLPELTLADDYHYVLVGPYSTDDEARSAESYLSETASYRFAEAKSYKGKRYVIVRETQDCDEAKNHCDSLRQQGKRVKVVPSCPDETTPAVQQSDSQGAHSEKPSAQTQQPQEEPQKPIDEYEYRVYVGDYLTYEDARNEQVNLEKKGYTSEILHSEDYLLMLGVYADLETAQSWKTWLRDNGFAGSFVTRKKISQN
jgi:cell division septation protein DedD